MRYVYNFHIILLFDPFLDSFYSLQVCDLEPALKLLEQQSSNEDLKWETRYCLLLWLSIIVMIPFDMSRLDPSGVEETTASR